MMTKTLPSAASGTIIVIVSTFSDTKIDP